MSFVTSKLTGLVESCWGAMVNNLSVLYKDQGKMAQAEQMFVRANNLGPQCGDQIISMKMRDRITAPIPP